METTLRGWNFPIEIDKNTGKIKTIEDNANIKQAVKIILGTQKYERKIVPNFGTDLRSFMFEIVDPGLVSTLKNSINSSLKLWESHIRDLNVSVKASSGPISKVEAIVDYITDIEPTQEQISTRIDSNDK